MFRSILTGIGLALSVSVAQAAGFADCPQFFAGNHPPVVHATQTRELCFSHFAVLHSGITRTPVFSAERLTPDEVKAAKKVKRKDQFFADHRLPESERAELSDYAGSGYDRGHMSPDHDQPDETSMAQSFSLANMVPQSAHNNRGPWAGYEKATRQYIERSGHTVYLITGPVFGRHPQQLNGRVSIPSQIYKLVYDPTAGRAWAYWTDNTDDARSGAPISYQELTHRLGYELLPGLNPRS